VGYPPHRQPDNDERYRQRCDFYGVVPMGVFRGSNLSQTSRTTRPRDFSTNFSDSVDGCECDIDNFWGEEVGSYYV